jgi:hypothetical protein
MTPEALLRVLDSAIDIVIDSKWPDGVPSVPQDKPRCWYEDTDNQLRDLAHKKEHLLKKWKSFQIDTTPPSALKKCREEDLRRSERRIRNLLRKKRNKYWDDNSKLLDEAYQKKGYEIILSESKSNAW